MSNEVRRSDNVFIKGTGPKVRPPRTEGLRKPSGGQPETAGRASAPPQRD